MINKLKLRKLVLFHGFALPRFSTINFLIVLKICRKRAVGKLLYVDALLFKKTPLNSRNSERLSNTIKITRQHLHALI